MPPKQQPHTPKAISGGPLHAVICPSCGHPNDFRELLISGGETTVYTGAEVSCDACDMISVVARVQPITFVTLKRTNRKAKVERSGGLVRR